MQVLYRSTASKHTHTYHAVYIATTSPCFLILCGRGRIISSAPMQDEEIVVVIVAGLHTHAHTHTCMYRHMHTHTHTHFLPTSLQRHEAEGLKFKSAEMHSFDFLLTSVANITDTGTHTVNLQSLVPLVGRRTTVICVMLRSACINLPLLSCKGCDNIVYTHGWRT